MAQIPQMLLERLCELEPKNSFNGSLPRITSSSGSVYFAKIGSPSEVEQFLGEAESLKAMNEVASGIAPRVFSCGVTKTGAPYFISEYRDISPLHSNTEAANELAKRLATEMHAEVHLGGFGFSIPTYCGPTRLKNGMFKTWHECFASQIGDLLDQLGQKGYSALCDKGATVKIEVIPKLLGHLDVKPVILHGDLWSGNAGVERRTGKPVIFDPASYYGHNEADLSITRIFGGFPKSFYTTYHEYRSKTEPVGQYDLRMDLYELFHYLNHTLIFGGSYAASAEMKMDVLIAAFQDSGF